MFILVSLRRASISFHIEDVLYEHSFHRLFAVLLFVVGERSSPKDLYAALEEEEEEKKAVIVAMGENTSTTNHTTTYAAAVDKPISYS